MKTYGLAGYPLSHSFSKKFFEEKFRRENITDAQFLNFEIAAMEKLAATLAAQPNLCGFSVTIPHKISILHYLAELSPDALAIGAVNCVKVSHDGKWIGYNTDAHGFEKSIRPFLDSRHDRALVLGTGGAARAVAHVLGNLGIAFKYVSRNALTAQTIAYSDIGAEAIRHFRLIVNATPLGMFPQQDGFPLLPYESLTASHFLYDLVYNPEETEFLRRGRNHGSMTMNGREMLQYQAEESWRIWNLPGNQPSK